MKSLGCVLLIAFIALIVAIVVKLLSSFTMHELIQHSVGIGCILLAVCVILFLKGLFFPSNR